MIHYHKTSIEHTKAWGHKRRMAVAFEPWHFSRYFPFPLLPRCICWLSTSSFLSQVHAAKTSWLVKQARFQRKLNRFTPSRNLMWLWSSLISLCGSAVLNYKRFTVLWLAQLSNEERLPERSQITLQIWKNAFSSDRLRLDMGLMIDESFQPLGYPRSAWLTIMTGYKLYLS